MAVVISDASPLIGILIEAKRHGLVHSLRNELELVRRDSQLQLTPVLEQLALQLAGETF